MKKKKNNEGEAKKKEREKKVFDIFQCYTMVKLYVDLFSVLKVSKLLIMLHARSRSYFFDLLKHTRCDEHLILYPYKINNDTLMHWWRSMINNTAEHLCVWLLFHVTKK